MPEIEKDTHANMMWAYIHEASEQKKLVEHLKHIARLRFRGQDEEQILLLAAKILESRIDNLLKLGLQYFERL